LAEQFSRWAFYGFDHCSAVLGVNADIEQKSARLEVICFVETDFPRAEFSEAEVEPCVVGSFFLEADFDAFHDAAPYTVVWKLGVDFLIFGLFDCIFVYFMVVRFAV